MQKILGYARRGIQTYNMISAGDKIAVGVSGGKDSLALLVTMARLRTVLDGGFDIVAIALDPRFGSAETDFSPVKTLCDKLCVPFVLERTDIGPIVFDARQEKNPCSLCAHMRRGALCKKASELGCNKVALGHHMDDALETFVMNLQNGSLGCFSPVTELTDSKMTIIRPLLLAPEHEISKSVRRAGLTVVKSKCPIDGTSRRQQIKDFLLENEKKDPGLKERMLGAICRAHLCGW